jgi:hypothetical protein
MPDSFSVPIRSTPPHDADTPLSALFPDNTTTPKRRREAKIVEAEGERRERSKGKHGVSKKMEDSRSRSLKAEISAESDRTMDTDKALPKTPTLLESQRGLQAEEPPHVEGKELAKSISQLYARHVHSMRETPGRKPLSRNANVGKSSGRATTSFSSLPVQSKSLALRIWGNPRAAPIPRERCRL